MQIKLQQVEQLQADAAQQAAIFKAKLQQHSLNAEAETSALQDQLAASRGQADAAELQGDSLRMDLASARSQLEAVQQQNGKLLSNLAAAQREAGEASRQLKQAEADLKQLQAQSTTAAVAGQQAQRSMQAEHALAVEELQYVNQLHAYNIFCTAPD